VIVVVDTNVIISSFLKPFSDSAKILRMVLENKLKLGIDLRILIEYEEVLKRPEFMFDKNKIDLIINFIRKGAVFVNPLPLGLSLPDEDDSPFLEVAISAKAKYLITGNTKHFPKELCKETKIVSPSEFLKDLNPYNLI
jgi:putative PIN family toxin of toxin-antitoxin system